MQVPPTAAISAAHASSPSTDRPLTATRAPSAAYRTAIAVPMPPWLAPVTSATRPSSSSVIASADRDRIAHAGEALGDALAEEQGACVLRRVAQQVVVVRDGRGVALV